ncbi:mastermind-like protein 1 [Acanthochromis polyacanthus]|uniref:mastermind-like protein 1 n=1 Tax=Acanthochromis polyacanthus TaxID=80966 RepID=UPI002233EE21|nr:mastermind-like protein 1 [Acanthochromis polyacanthus]XP_051810470.1 mastermind-like protein 1 [Acanthochromis polyacanthus]XP_051810472.1 mastermind-like protein 1 [Acanthochromis polyacanthus]XP_051810473.1 mastermind-like protein 1 [Acanthochromis polyacanthus]XP_051810474.1 mastermind-like protein 1 [Acanthochromis polyacanthus]XP_051810475.1 mastermind-like protein 1 [Acanthochromis polyacanthus]XP_051810476.1 mastermind-like protein 1 [Acanthochromis polyacanthus]XP_051810477.1 mas
MMADFVTPRHSAVMERLRRRIELFRQHHNSCENRYENATLERLELERQQTFALHQRCLQAKAKRSNKHRQPQTSSDQAGQRAPGGGGGGGGGGAEHGESGGTAAEQSRNSTLIALQETVKRKLESAGSPLGRDQVNGYSDGFPPTKKACLDNGPANGSPLDSKVGISDSLSSNGTHGPGAEAADGSGEPGSDFHRKEMKQEPDDILPIMPPSGGNNSLFPDLNLNEQEWTELMEELNCSVAYEDIQDILNDGFEDRKDPLELAPTPGGGASVGGTSGGGAAGGGQSSGLLPPDLASVKAEFSPASAVFEQDSRTASPHVRSTSSGPPHPTSSPVASSSASSPALPPSQPAPPPRQLQPPPNHLLPPGPPGPPGPKDLSPAQQLQQLAAQQQRAQHLHGQIHKQPQPGAKFHSQGPHAHPSPWPQMANTSPSPAGGAFGMDKPSSPSLYPQDFNPQKQLLMPGQPNKGSPKAGAGSYMQGPSGHPNMLGHLTSGPLSHPSAAGAQAPAAMLNYNNTKPLSHFEAGPGPPRPPGAQNQNKAALLTLLRQQQQQQIKQKNSMNFRQHIPHSQDQNSYPAPPHGPANAMTSAPGNNGMSAQQGASAMVGNQAYLNSQVAAALKQQQILEQQKQQQYMQRQQLMAEQEKQRQQDQQLQRHLTRPPPQYQDQPGPPANQNPFPQQPVNQFTASSQPMSSVSSMGGPAPNSRMFPQTQSMLGMNMGQTGGPTGGVAPPPAASQADISLPSCGGGGASYSSMSLHPAHPPQQAALQRQPLGAMSAPYRQNLLQQQHLKPNAAMLKQQHLAAARMPGSMQGGPPGAMPGGMTGGQNAAWQQQLSNQPPSSPAGLPPNAFSPPTAFHPQQQRMSKMTPGSAPFGANPAGRPMGGLNTGQQMMQTNMATAQQRALPTPQSLANQQQAQQQQANQNQVVLSDLAAFGQPQGNGRQGLQCNQGYQVSRTANQQQQQVSFGYNVASGSFAAESELVDSLLKGQSTQEWMADLDELLASHH